MPLLPLRGRVATLHGPTLAGKKCGPSVGVTLSSLCRHIVTTLCARPAPHGAACSRSTPPGPELGDLLLLALHLSQRGPTAREQWWRRSEPLAQPRRAGLSHSHRQRQRSAAARCSAAAAAAAASAPAGAGPRAGVVRASGVRGVEQLGRGSRDFYASKKARAGPRGGPNLGGCFHTTIY